ncbi:hypothetical protein GCM10025298_31960 [Natronobiforma cellulositropha]
MDSRRGGDGRLVPLEDLETPPLDDGCGPAAYPLSALLSRERGRHSRDPCFDGATTALAVENERDGPVDAAVTVTTSSGSTVLERSYRLSAQERRLESNVLDGNETHTATVTIDGESTTASWDGPSCYRHGLAILPEGLAIGYVEPDGGIGDTQYDCYAGDDTVLFLSNDGLARTVAVEVVDDCHGETADRTLEVGAGERARIDGVLEAGGRFTVRIDVAGDRTASFTLSAVCRGVEVRIDEDGTVEARYWEGESLTGGE